MEKAETGGRVPGWAVVVIVVLMIVAGVLIFSPRGESDIPPGALPTTTGPTTALTTGVAARGGPAVIRPGSRERVDERDAMIRDLLRYHTPQVTDERVIAAMRAVPRHRLIPGEQRLAYADMPLPIGYGQTISQPYIVALMSQLLQTKPGDRVLEVGTGSGYQAAVLAEMGCEAYTIEIVEPLGRRAAKNLDELKYDRVHSRVGDGYYGWEAHGPYDAIVVTAAATHVPPALIEQLKPGGRICIPVGHAFGNQDLLVVTKQADGSVRSRSIIPVRFVPFTGGHERPDAED